MTERRRHVDLSAYGPTLRSRAYRVVMGISATTLSRQLRAGTCEVQPALCRPYRWVTAEVQEHLETVTLAADRQRKARRRAA